MSTRTTETTVTFEHPFTLSSVDGAQPAGTYRLITDEEEISGLSFIGFRRVATSLYVPAASAPGSSVQVFQVDPAELAAALASDRRTTA
ncbi:MAG: hypothetical protein ACLQL2_06400 [Methylovirgula sp.]